MNISTLRRRSAATAAVLALSISLAACGSEDDDDNAGDNGTDASQSSDPAPETDSESADTGDADPAAQTFGPACDQIPGPGEPGSFEGMATDPVATAAGTNPLLKTLVQAVTAVPSLPGTLDTAPADPGLTVFAPYDPAFEEIPAADFEQLATDAAEQDTDSALFKILAHHVLPESLAPDAIDGDQTTLVGDDLTISGDTESGITVSDGTVDAKVLCGNIPTANATVYVIDKVLTGTDTE